MQYLKHVLLFSKNNYLQLRRKWLTLPLLLLFPVMTLGLIVFIVVSFFSPNESEPITVALVDLDETEETEMVIQLMEESSQLGDYIHMQSMTETQAKQQIEENTIISYIIFPDQFTEKLYTGQSITLDVVGNPNFTTESYIISELVESIIRHITVSQASILTINEYAKDLPMDADTRSDFLFEQFKEFLFFALGKDRVLSEKELKNDATANPLIYFGIGGWFIVVTIWLFSIYNFLYRENTIRIKQRMKLYGVTNDQQIIARGITTLSVVLVLIIISMVSFVQIAEYELSIKDSLRILFFMTLYSVILLECMAIIEIWVKSHRLRLLLQIIFITATVLVSGAIIPTIYFPLYIQEYTYILFSTEIFYWLKEIILNHRVYVEYLIPLLTSISLFFLLFASSLWKERNFK